MPQLLNLQIPPATLAMLADALDAKQLRQAQYQVVNRTLGKLVTRIRKAVHDENELIKTKYINRVIEKLPAKGDPPVGAVIVKAKRLPLTAFRVKAVKSGGVSVQLARDLPPVLLKHGFLATVKVSSKAGEEFEHTGVFLRGSGPPGAMTKDRKGNLRKYTPQGFAERLPIKQQFGPTLLKIIEIPEVLKGIDLDTAAEMEKQALSQLARFTDSKAPAAG